MKVRMYGSLRSVIGTKEAEVRISGGSTVRHVLDQLGAAYPSLRAKVRHEGEMLPQGVNVLVNGRSARYLNGLDTPVVEGDELALFPPVGGG